MTRSAARSSHRRPSGQLCAICRPQPACALPRATRTRLTGCRAPLASRPSRAAQGGASADMPATMICSSAPSSPRSAPPCSSSAIVALTPQCSGSHALLDLPAPLEARVARPAPTPRQPSRTSTLLLSSRPVTWCTKALRAAYDLTPSGQQNWADWLTSLRPPPRPAAPGADVGPTCHCPSNLSCARTPAPAQAAAHGSARRPGTRTLAAHLRFLRSSSPDASSNSSDRHGSHPAHGPREIFG